jgi:hypothetical protein
VEKDRHIAAYKSKGMTYGLCAYSILLHFGCTEWAASPQYLIALTPYHIEDLNRRKLFGIVSAIIVHAVGTAGVISNANKV